MGRAAIRRGTRSILSRGCAGGSGNRLLEGREPSLKANLPGFPVKASLAGGQGRTGSQGRLCPHGRQNWRAESTNDHGIAGGSTHLILPKIQIAIGPVSEVFVFHGLSAL